MVKKKRKLPKRFVSIDKVSRTRFVQDKKTGRMIGRKRVSGVGDRTVSRRIKSGPRAGQILGRTPPIKVRASKKKRGSVRRL